VGFFSRREKGDPGGGKGGWNRIASVPRERSKKKGRGRQNVPNEACQDFKKKKKKQGKLRASQTKTKTGNRPKHLIVMGKRGRGGQKKKRRGVRIGGSDGQREHRHHRSDLPKQKS